MSHQARRLRLPIGRSDFRKLQRDGQLYVDKTAFVRDFLRFPEAVVLFPRPRRFGKSLNLSTLRWFVEKPPPDAPAPGVAGLFEGLEVWSSEDAREHFQRYPVVNLSFKEVGGTTWERCRSSIRYLLATEIERHQSRLSRLDTLAIERDILQRVLDRRADVAELELSLQALCRCLERAENEPVVVLVDEYDVPIQAAWRWGFYDEAISFFRSLYVAALKDEPHLHSAAITGVLRVAREGLFSGVNHIRVQSILESEHATAFGFTEPEVADLCRRAGHEDQLDRLRTWYDGYTFGDQRIYNPWSILNYLRSPERGPRPYWVNTSSDDAIRSLLLDRGAVTREDLETLLAGATLRREVSEHVVLRDAERKPHALWSLLLLSGYLTSRATTLERGRIWAELAIPNEELRYVFETGIWTWLDDRVEHLDRQQVSGLFEAILSGDQATFQRTLSVLVTDSLSYHDPAGPAPERVYHAFLLGLLVGYGPDYEVRSNRESGHGRVDVMIAPRQSGHPGAVLELKVLATAEASSAPTEAAQQALERALQQIDSLRYTAELEARGATPIRRWAVVFDGKRVWTQVAAQAGTQRP